MDNKTFLEIEKQKQKEKREEKKQNSKGIWYAGNDILGNFNLYDVDMDADNYDFDEIKMRILQEFKEKYEKEIKQILKEHGIKLLDLYYYSPQYYNFDGDSIDLKVKITNKQKIKSFVIENRHKIQKIIDENQPCDGFIPSMAWDIKDILRDIEELNKIDISVLSVMFSEFRQKIDVIELIQNNIL